MTIGRSDHRTSVVPTMIIAMDRISYTLKTAARREGNKKKEEKKKNAGMDGCGSADGAVSPCLTIPNSWVYKIQRFRVEPAGLNATRKT